MLASDREKLGTALDIASVDGKIIVKDTLEKDDEAEQKKKVAAELPLNQVKTSLYHCQRRRPLFVLRFMQPAQGKCCTRWCCSVARSPRP